MFRKLEGEVQLETKSPATSGDRKAWVKLERAKKSKDMRIDLHQNLELGKMK